MSCSHQKNTNKRRLIDDEAEDADASSAFVENPDEEGGMACFRLVCASIDIESVYLHSKLDEFVVVYIEASLVPFVQPVFNL